jgi:flagellar L-ring protein precursor FlgH
VSRPLAWLGLGAVAWALAAAPAPAAAYSLWTSRSGSLVTDLRASRAGDLLTIVIDEQTSGSKSGETKLEREGAFRNEFNPPPFNYPSWLARILFNLRASGSGTSDYEGKGRTTREDRAAGTITARVVRVEDNGVMLVEGRRLVSVHEEALTVVVSGLVRAQDIGPDNLVRSSLLGDAEIRIEGKGVISRRQQPGLFQRLFDWLGAF